MSKILLLDLSRNRATEIAEMKPNKSFSTPVGIAIMAITLIVIVGFFALSSGEAIPWYGWVAMIGTMIVLSAITVPLLKLAAPEGPAQKYRDAFAQAAQVKKAVEARELQKAKGELAGEELEQLLNPSQQRLVQVLIIRWPPTKTSYVAGDSFTPSPFVIDLLKRRGWLKDCTTNVRTGRAESSFDEDADALENRVRFLTLRELDELDPTTEYQVVNLGERGALWSCPACSTLLRKSNALLAAKQNGRDLPGVVTCIGCSKEFPQTEVGEGRYDV